MAEMIDMDPANIGIGAAIGGAVATVLDWLDRKRVDDKFGRLNGKMETMKNDLSIQKTELVALEKSQDAAAQHMVRIDSKIDLLLVKVGELTGSGKGK
jgi:hypothetical protein